MTPGQNWQSVWAARRLDPTKGSQLAQLMAADGLDTGFGSVSEPSWRAFARRTSDALGLAHGDRVFEVGCGAGAFLLDLYERGIEVAGLDQSAALIEIARAAMPRGSFSIADASAVDGWAQADVVLACGVFMYFPTLDYARGVVTKMAANARRAVAVLDVPDLAKQAAALEHRRGTLGPEEYAARYAGLDHLYYAKDWMREVFEAAGLGDVRVEDQAIPGYANAAYRFNVFGVSR